MTEYEKFARKRSFNFRVFKGILRLRLRSASETSSLKSWRATSQAALASERASNL